MIFYTIYYDPLNFEVNRVNRVIRVIRVIRIVRVILSGDANGEGRGKEDGRKLHFEKCWFCVVTLHKRTLMDCRDKNTIK